MRAHLVVGVVTPGASREVTLPDGGGRVEQSGSNPNFGGILAISAQGYSELKLTQ